MMRRQLLAVMLIACSPVHAQTASIILNDVDLRLGMTKDEVLRKLKMNNKVILQQMRPPTLDIWCLKWVSDKSADACSSIGGTIGFSAGRLYSARKDLFEVRDEESAAGLISRLFTAFTELKASGQNMVEFETFEAPNFDGANEVRTRQLVFLLKGTKMLVTVNQPLGGSIGSSVVVSEEISEFAKK